MAEEEPLPDLSGPEGYNPAVAHSPGPMMPGEDAEPAPPRHRDPDEYEDDHPLTDAQLRQPEPVDVPPFHDPELDGVRSPSTAQPDWWGELKSAGEPTLPQVGGTFDPEVASDLGDLSSEPEGPPQVGDPATTSAGAVSPTLPAPVFDTESPATTAHPWRWGLVAGVAGALVLVGVAAVTLSGGDPPASAPAPSSSSIAALTPAQLAGAVTLNVALGTTTSAGLPLLVSVQMSKAVSGEQLVRVTFHGPGLPPQAVYSVAPGSTETKTFVVGCGNWTMTVASVDGTPVDAAGHPNLTNGAVHPC